MRKLEKLNLEFKQQVVAKLIKGVISNKQAQEFLGCKRLTVFRYVKKVAQGGSQALKDQRHGNNYKLTPKQLSEILKKKEEGFWRSARKVKEIANNQAVGERRVQQIWVEHGLNQMNVERLKPITRFVAKALADPHDLLLEGLFRV